MTPQLSTTAGLLSGETIREQLIGNDPWVSTHGADADRGELGAGLLYYALAYALQSRVCVCLGSGGGFVPRLMRQAQRDLGLADSRTILVDGVGKVDDERLFWGTPCWVDEQSLLRTAYPDVEIVFELTATAYEKVFLPEGIRIDYLHIDADHHYDGAKLDWDLFGSLVEPGGVITLHDTVNVREPCGVPRLIDEIRADPRYEVVNFPIAYGTAIVRRSSAES